MNEPDLLKVQENQFIHFTVHLIWHIIISTIIIILTAHL